MSGAEVDSPQEMVQIFAEGSYSEGTLTWGWQCFRCRDEAVGFGCATTAGEGRDNHLCTAPTQHQDPPC